MKRARALTGWIWLLVLAVLASGGCVRDESGEPGVAATVNGEVITVADLEARHDLSRLGLPGADNPAVERLRAEYGEVLSAMIVARLAGQELVRLRLSVTEAELAAAEAAIRADYPGEAFEAMLLEERVELPRWRGALRDRLTVDKFAREVLRPNVRVGVSEAADYYKDHIDAFTLPARTRLLLVRAGEAEALKAALAVWRKAASSGTPAAPAVLDGLAGITVQEVALSDKALPKAWREALRPLKPGEASQPLAGGEGQAALILLERHGETVLEPAKAYARVEALLSARKLDQAFAAWLADSLSGATIRVNAVLAAASAPAQGSEPDRPSPPGDSASAGAAGDEPRDTSGPAREAAAAKPVETPTSAPAPAVAGVDAPTPEPVPAEAEAPVQAPSQASTPASPPVETSAASPPAEASAPGPAVLPDQTPAAAEASPAAPAATPAEPAGDGSVPAVAASPPAAPGAGESGAGAAMPGQAPPPAAGGHEAEFEAVKASWILFVVDNGEEDRTYLKPGKPFRIAFVRKLSVRLGSPSEVTCRFGGRETTVTVGKKESRILEFP